MMLNYLFLKILWKDHSNKNPIAHTHSAKEFTHNFPFARWVDSILDEGNELMASNPIVWSCGLSRRSSENIKLYTERARFFTICLQTKTTWPRNYHTIFRNGFKSWALQKYWVTPSIPSNQNALKLEIKCRRKGKKPQMCWQ